MGNVFGTRNARDFQIATMDEMGGSVKETIISTSWKVIEKEESEFEIVLEKVIKATVDDAKNGKESEFHAFTTAMLEYEKQRLSIEKQRWADTNQWSELERERLDIEKERLNSQLVHQRDSKEETKIQQELRLSLSRTNESQQRTIYNLSRTIESQQRTIESQQATIEKLVTENIESTKKENNRDDEDQDEVDRNDDEADDDDDDDEGDDAVES